jgi:hypothetical protein
MEMIVCTGPIGTRENAIVVWTPLDAISRLEGTTPISTVVLAGRFAHDTDLMAFLSESYPSIRIEQEA